MRTLVKREFLLFNPERISWEALLTERRDNQVLLPALRPLLSFTGNWVHRDKSSLWRERTPLGKSLGCGLSLSHLGSEKGTPCFPAVVETRDQHNRRSFFFKSKTVLTLEGVRGLAGIAARRVRSLHRPSSGGWFDLAWYPDFLLTALLIFFRWKRAFPLTLLYNLSSLLLFAPRPPAVTPARRMHWELAQPDQTNKE